MQFDAWLAATNRDTDAAAVDRRDVEAWLANLLEDKSANTAAARYRSLRQFFRWLADEEDELPASPMASMRPPKVPDQPVPVLTHEQLAALVKACAGTTFNDRRDIAIVRTLLDTGGRLSEVANLRLVDASSWHPDSASSRGTLLRERWALWSPYSAPSSTSPGCRTTRCGRC